MCLKIHLHEIHVVESNVVELSVLDYGGGARVVGGVNQGQHLVSIMIQTFMGTI